MLYEVITLVLKSGSGEIGTHMLKEEHRLPMGTGIVGHTFETATPFVTNNVNDVMFFVITSYSIHYTKLYENCPNRKIINSKLLQEK